MRLAKNQLEAGEEVIASIRDHWIVLLKPFAFLFLGGILFLLFFFIAAQLDRSSLVTRFSLISVALAIFFGSYHLFFLFLIRYLFSDLVVTNKRLIRVYFFPFYEDNVSFIEIQEIHEIEKKKHGFIKNLLNYGNVEFNLSSKVEPIVLENIRYPTKFVIFVDAIRFNKPISALDLKILGAQIPDSYSKQKKS